MCYSGTVIVSSRLLGTGTLTTILERADGILGLSEVLERLPRHLPFGVAEPLDQVFDTSGPVASTLDDPLLDDPLDFPLFVTVLVDQLRWWARGFRGWTTGEVTLGGRLQRLQLRHVEHRMDTHGRWEVEFVCDGRHDTLHLEGADE